MSTHRPKRSSSPALEEYRSHGHLPSDGSVSYPASTRRRQGPALAQPLRLREIIGRHVIPRISAQDAAELASFVALTSLGAAAAFICFGMSAGWF